MSKINPTTWIWKDGSFIKWQDATVHVLSHSIQFGSSAFEGVRCYETNEGPAIFRLKEHLIRLKKTVHLYRTDLEWSVDQLADAACELVRRNDISECYIRPMVVHGFGSAGMIPVKTSTEVYICCWPWGSYLGNDALEKGVDVCISSWNRVAPNTIPAMAKVAGNYLSGQLIKMEAVANGFHEGLAMGTDGTLSEGAGQNVFVIVDGEILTTPLNGSILAGITRSTVIELAREIGYTVRECQIARETLYGADEIFLTGTASEVTPIRSIDRIQIGSGKRGEITTKIQSLYLDLVHGKLPDHQDWLTRV